MLYISRLVFLNISCVFFYSLFLIAKNHFFDPIHFFARAKQLCVGLFVYCVCLI